MTFLEEFLTASTKNARGSTTEFQRKMLSDYLQLP
jgi:hypothetical protein